jgi:capsular polysaccharide biosynthesis protein
LKQIRLGARKWSALWNAYSIVRYYIPRLTSFATFPLLGARAALRGFHETARDFLRQGGGSYIDLEPPSSTLRPARSADHALFVAVIPKGRSLYDCGVVVTPDHKLLADVSWQTFALDQNKSNPLHHFAMRKLVLPKARQIGGNVAVLSSVQPGNFYHWLFDILPRLGMIRRSGHTPECYIVNADKSFQQESLRLLNIPSSMIISPTMSSHIQPDTLIVPSLPGPIFGLTPQARSCEFLRSSFLTSSHLQAAHRLIYISRADARERRVINESEVLEMILPIGFEILTLTGMPFDKQVELFSQARVVLGPHGAGFSNAVFCQRGSVLIEFMPKGKSVDCFERLAGFVGMDYHVIASDVDGAPGESGDSDDHYVDLAELRQVIHQVLDVD